MEVKNFFAKLESFCKVKQKSKNRCHDCELLNFCYSPPAGFKENCNIDEVIELITGLKD